MRAFLATFQTGFKYLWRNPVNMAILTVFPIMLILIITLLLSVKNHFKKYNKLKLIN